MNTQNEGQQSSRCQFAATRLAVFATLSLVLECMVSLAPSRSCPVEVFPLSSEAPGTLSLAFPAATDAFSQWSGCQPSHFHEGWIPPSSSVDTLSPSFRSAKLNIKKATVFPGIFLSPRCLNYT
ncbi:unnamed protein product [Ixodes persulcatus]